MYQFKVGFLLPAGHVASKNGLADYRGPEARVVFNIIANTPEGAYRIALRRMANALSANAVFVGSERA